MDRLEVIYEDDDMVAFNKPPGVLFDWALVVRPELTPVHRLDKDTSGIILFAKNGTSADYLKGLFQSHRITKTYLALVTGVLRQNTGVIDLAIGRSARTPLKRIAVGKKRGKAREAITKYTVLKRFACYTYIEAHPETGRTHQIRSHFAAIGHPIVCDSLYGGKRPVCPGGLNRHFLHAKAVEFTLSSGSRLRLEADLPKDLEKALRAITE